MSTKLSFKIPKEVLFYLVFCTLGILCFLMVVILPSRKKLSELNRKIVQVKTGVKEQQLLLPAYVSLAKKEKAISTVLEALPTRQALPREQIRLIPSLLNNVAAKQHLTLTSITLDPKSLAHGSDLLDVDFTAKGAFSLLQGFLLDVKMLPYLEGIKMIELSSASGGEVLKLKMKLLVGR